MNTGGWEQGPKNPAPTPAEKTGGADTNKANGANATAAPIARPLSPLDVIRQWGIEGPLVRVSTGIDPLDEMSRGGVAFPWRVIIVGAPSAGKTFVATCIADSMARRLMERGIVVGILAIDEEADDVTVRLAQIAGFSVEAAERRESATLDAMADALRLLSIRLYDATWTIEAAAADLAAAARDLGTRAALFIDSLHTATSARAIEMKADTDRARIEANVAAIRSASTSYRMLVIATAEANRNSYRSEDAAESSNDLAAGAESRAIEYGAQTQLMLRTPKGHPDVIHVRVAKNRRCSKGEFWLEIDRARHRVTPCDNPEPIDNAEAAAARDETKRESRRAGVERDARALAAIVRARPGVSERDLRGAAKVEGLGGIGRLDGARALLSAGFESERLVDRGAGGGSGSGKARAWHMEPIAGSVSGVSERVGDTPDTPERGGCVEAPYRGATQTHPPLVSPCDGAPDTRHTRRKRKASGKPKRRRP